MPESVVLRDLPPVRIVQVHVSAPPELLRTRLLDRDLKRHPVHYDREAADEIVALALVGTWDPLPLEGALIRVDGTKPVDAEAVARVCLGS